MNQADRLFLASKLPLITLTDRAGIIAGAITGRTNGFYNHVMWTWRVDDRTDHPLDLRVASQDALLRDKSLDPYVAKCRIKFVYNPNWTEEQREVLRAYIRAMLKLPWRKRLYDYRGIIGQLLGLPNYNFPGLRYCSEFVGDGIRLLESSFQYRHPTPADINRWCKERPEMVTLAKWDADEKRLVRY